MVVAHEKTQERVEHDQQDVAAKHQAEVQSLRTRHALELETLNAKHRKKLQEVTRQNEVQLARSRRLAREVLDHYCASATSAGMIWSRTHLLDGLQAERAGAFNVHSDSYADFLEYIDDFYADTLRLTEGNRA